MSGVARQRAEHVQRLASNPDVSAFVAASAGSGKTKLLTDRLLRLMLTGADPGRIQCLTFTKAAAAEMALRLQSRLGEWVTLDDAALDGQLKLLAVAPTDPVRAKARALFAQVLDLPGGMRISTIHAFCQSLLRRFPLEAQLSPHFSLVDGIDAVVALREAREDMLSRAHTPALRAALQRLAGLATERQFGLLVTALQGDSDRLREAAALDPARLEAAQRRLLGVEEADDAAVIARGVRWPAEDAMHEATAIVVAQGATKCREKSERLLGWLSLPSDDRAEYWAAWRDEFLLADGAPRGAGVFLNPTLAKSRPDLVESFAAEQIRVGQVEDRRRALQVAAISAALVSLAAPVAEAYAGRKDRAGLLDYDDLIARTSRLLIDPGAAWVLYKLDGGLDHLLLDEVQDTAPAQWKIAGALTREFFTGSGARDARRTVFAVGDIKQSIYSFQGADPAEFERWRGILQNWVENAGQTWQPQTLDVSFRSTAPVLALVDAVFEDPLAAAGVAEPGTLRHIADRAGWAGRVELWPLTPQPPQAAPEPWTVPEENAESVGAPQRLAGALAAWIKAHCGTDDLPSKGRKLLPGDVLVLVRRRNEFATALVRALKTLGVPVAGLDRLMLTEQPAVADLLALCDTLLLPQDSLSLACVLTSPLGGLTDDDLLELAPQRRGSLWDELRSRHAERPAWAQAYRFIATLMARADYATPHALLSEALGPLGGRAKLFGRLGPEAAEPVDELLSAALTYAESHPPSLQGFVHWLRLSGAEVKREAEGAGAAVRIMTVHGAKGLQAPLVILPDTTALPPNDTALLWADDPEGGPALPFWAPRKELCCTAIDTWRADAIARRDAEHNRLLYVALTRAEDRLLVCGWEPGKGVPDTCWYELVRRGFTRLDAASQAFDTVPGAWEGMQLTHETPQVVPPAMAKPAATASAGALPSWAGGAPGWTPAPPPEEPALPSPLAPSRPENIGLGPVPLAASPLAGRDATGLRFRRGQLVHALLQHLPALPLAERLPAARRFLARPGHAIPAAELDTLADEVLAVLEHPGLTPLFGPAGRAEVPLTGVVAGKVIGGLVDRLAVLPEGVLIADYKTNRDPPADMDAVPVLYLRQMAAYRAVLRAMFPDRPVTCALVWTTGARVMSLPDSLLDRHAPGAGLPA